MANGIMKKTIILSQKNKLGKIKGLSKILNCQRITQKKLVTNFIMAKLEDYWKKTMPHSTTLFYPLLLKLAMF